MFNSLDITNCFKNLIGWRNHYDTDEIPTLSEELTTSNSGEYFQDYHPALRLDLIQACIPTNRNLEEYLTEKTNNAIVQLVNQIISVRKYDNYSKETLNTEVLLLGYGWAKDTIVNESRFVGFRITPMNTEGLVISLDSIGFQFSEIQTDLTIYLYHSSKLSALKVFNFSSTEKLDWTWVQEEINLHSQNSEFIGGSFILGYYQDDLSGQAINMTNFNWKSGPCGTCDGGIKRNRWKSFNKYASVQPIYVPSSSLNADKTVMDFRDSIVSYEKSWGMNLKISAKCDLTDFICNHKNTLKKALALKVTYLILKDMQFSIQTNHIEEDLKSLIIRDLEGDKDTNYINIVDSLIMEIEGINFDHSGVSNPCLPCKNTNAPKYGVA